MASTSAWIVEYCCVDEYPLSAVLYGRHNQGTRRVPHCYGVLQSGDRIVMVDVGMAMTPYGTAMANAHAILRFQPATEMLGRIGLDPADVELVILTHGHFDHAAGLADFPRAEVVIQRRELEMLESLDELSPRRRWLANAIDPQTPHDVRALRDAGRLTTVDGETELLPGITVAPAYDTHTTGSQYVMVDTDHDGRWIFAGDVIYVYENLEGAGGDGVMIPIGLANGSQELDLLAMEAMLDAVGGETRRVLPVHDEQLWSRFPSHEWSDGLRMAEITLAPDHPSRLPAVAASGR